MMSIDVGLVVVGANLVGLVDRHTTGFGYRLEHKTFDGIIAN